MQQMTGAITTLTATLADRQNARARDAEFIKAGRSNTRANVLLITAGLGIVGGIGFMVFGHVDGNTAVGGCIISVVTLVWGFFCQGVSGWLISGPVAMPGALSTGRRRSTVTS
jgi:hypothetical protein